MPNCTLCQIDPATTRVYSDGYVLPCCKGCEAIWESGEGGAEDLWDRLLGREGQLERLVKAETIAV